MMIYKIALKDLKIVFRDKKALAIMLLMPISIMLILGITFNNMFSNDVIIKSFKIGVVNEDDGNMSDIFVNEVLHEGMKEVFDVTEVEYSEGKKLLRNEEVSVILIIPENFTSNIYKNNPVEIDIYAHMDKKFQSNIVKGVAQGFADNISYNHAAISALSGVCRKYEIPLDVNFEEISKTTALMNNLQQEISNKVPEFKEIQTEKYKNLSAMEYYSAAMLIMFLLFGVNFGIRRMVEERENNTLKRLMSTRVNRFTLITGKYLGLLFITSVQSVILILFTSIVYGVDWGDSVLGLVLVIGCSILAASALGMFIASVSGTAKAADAISMVLIQSFTIIGGGMVPLFIMPDMMKKTAKITLNYWAVRALHNMMLGSDMGVVLPCCGILIVMAVGYLVFGIVRFKV